MIIVFGSMNIDLIMPVSHFPKTGETVACTADYLSRTGGKVRTKRLPPCARAQKSRWPAKWATMPSAAAR